MSEFIHEQFDYQKGLRQLFKMKKQAGVNCIYTKDGQGYNARRIVFGYMRANPLVRRPRPSLSKASLEHVAIYDLLVRTAESIYQKYNNEFQVGEPKHTMGDTRFTGCVVNFSSAMRPHNDSGNVAGSKSAMLVMKAPGCVGGALNIHDLEQTLNFKDGDLLIFDGGKHLHSVSPIKGDRISIVFYTNKGL